MMRPNTLVLNGVAALALRRHPMLLKAFHGSLGDAGMVPLAFIQELFELDRIVVGRARYNSANKGQTLTLTELWQNHCALLYINPHATPSKGITFGFTATHGRRVAQSRRDPDIGLRGGLRMRVGESVKELVVADDVSYLFRNVI